MRISFSRVEQNKTCLNEWPKWTGQISCSDKNEHFSVDLYSLPCRCSSVIRVCSCIPEYEEKGVSPVPDLLSFPPLLRMIGQRTERCAPLIQLNRIIMRPITHYQHSGFPAWHLKFPYGITPFVTDRPPYNPEKSRCLLFSSLQTFPLHSINGKVFPPNATLHAQAHTTTNDPTSKQST